MLSAILRVQLKETLGESLDNFERQVRPMKAKVVGESLMTLWQSQ